MEFIKLTPENLGNEHICCAISNEKDCQVISKKAWLSARLEEGLVFLKANARGKCFIEYIPAENAWIPIEAEGYMYIDCFWVSGQMKGQGYSNELLAECIRDSRKKGKKGLCILSSQKKKMPFLADPKYLAYKGFQVADTAEPYYTLMYLPLEEGTVIPHFKEKAKYPRIEEPGIVIYYADQCPFTAKYVPLLEKIAIEKKVPFQKIHLESATQAQAAPMAFTSYGLFRDGNYVTNEIFSEKKFAEWITKE